MFDPSRIRHRIMEIYIADAFSTSGKIYIDFHDGNKERWYIIYVVEQRVFGRAARIKDGVGTIDIPLRLRNYLISIIPADIIATCTAASLGAVNFD
ncbi:hypothetical protein [Agrobacterium tumefaciens]|uniref:hypothetical protein n=1 Tax=Agrobacterium tumefaciens TaxID=358 RepID=UPI0015724AA1|nr:hypothetical protein [Agrobacterium tumefaciens]NTD85466.1 hypothetical protein [Agrobacterium tumefaciens]NTD90815.1 hypothetical protein [Agrobacterium tumefaciens]NTD96388.1 hypothetical protein [Agrobacterium tumefaciens]NTE15889.1 hypothetical protein [Agrobacterium tumefaciens]NTE23122.1 hypothetical protein [Agrobacterium tumefaciens]